MVRLITTSIRQLALPALASFDTLETLVSNARYFPCCQRTCPGHSAWAFQSVCALHSEVLASRVFCVWPGAGLRRWRQPMSSSATTPGAKVVGLGGLEPPASPLSGVRSNHLSYRPGCLQWWSLPGSNRRPPACKAGALPAELRPRYC